MIVSPSLVTGLPGRDSITATRLCRAILSRAAAGHEPRDRTRHNSALGIIAVLAADDREGPVVRAEVLPVQAAGFPRPAACYREQPDQGLVGRRDGGAVAHPAGGLDQRGDLVVAEQVRCWARVLARQHVRRRDL